MAPLLDDCNPHPQPNFFTIKQEYMFVSGNTIVLLSIHIIDHTNRFVITFHLLLYICVCSLTAYATQNKTHRLSNKNQKSYNHTLSHRSHLIWAIDPISITTNVILYAFSSLIFICIQTLTHSHTCIDI